jgi:hypothetical protein
MDIIAIILTIAACIAGLLILAGIAYAVVASVALKSVKKNLNSLDFRL